MGRETRTGRNACATAGRGEKSRSFIAALLRMTSRHKSGGREERFLAALGMTKLGVGMATLIGWKRDPSSLRSSG
jgi:hypothetical protein